MSRRVMEVLEDAARKWGAEPALRWRKGDEAWQTATWADYRDRVRTVAKALLALGVRAGEGVSIIGNNCPEWFYADVGAIYAGAVPAGIYTTSSPEQCQYIADHCDARVVVVEDAAQLAKFQQVRGQLPKLRSIVVMHGRAEGEGVLSWDAFLARAKDVPDTTLEARIAAQRVGDTATLIYTSGTTGNPKAVMITHENLVWTAGTVQQMLDGRPGDASLSYLPLSHIAEQMTSIHGPMAYGGCVHFARSLEKLGDDLRDVRPHYFVGVPRVWEKMQAKMMDAAKDAPPMRKKIAAWARKIGLEGGYADQRHEARPMAWIVANKLVFSKVKERLGLDRCRLQVTSAAPISKDTLEFFLSLGIPIYEIYGMSECTGPATVSMPARYRTGKAGYVMPGAELKIAADGEVCMRGKHVCKGYLKNPEATAEAIDAEGWLHSGDIGTIDEDGFLQITDRKKDLLITAGGENIAPQVLEGALKAIPVVMQAVVLGDRMKYLTALVTLDPEKLAEAAAHAGSPARVPQEAAVCPKMHAWIQHEVDTKVNPHLARVQTIKKVRILPQELTIDGGELTPTMKVKRKVVREKYAAEIAELYAE